MKMNAFAAMVISSLFAASVASAAPMDSDNIGTAQPSAPQLADNGAMSGANNMSGSSNNMSGTGSMSGTSSMSGSSNNMSGASSPSSDEGSADTATGDDY